MHTSLRKHATALWNRLRLRVPVPSWSTLCALYRYAQVIEVVRILRSRHGCPWDRKQTLASFLPYLKEEAAEVAAAFHYLQDGDGEPFAHELGDLLFVLTFLMVLADEAKAFALSWPPTSLVEKMVRRHPHVFATSPNDPDSIREEWQRIKAEEKRHQPPPSSVLARLKPSFSALTEAQRIGALVSRFGFDWPSLQGVWDKVLEEVAELKVELPSLSASRRDHQTQESVRPGARKQHTSPQRERQEQELGDLLFALTNLARHLEFDAEQALRQASHRFQQRFRSIERALRRRNQPLDQTPLDELEALWQQAKSSETPSP